MQILNHHLKLTTQDSISIHNFTADIQALIDQSDIQQGQALIFSCHTTTALAINEYEERLLVDIKTYLNQHD
ncbi:MAG: hypothetical protein F6J97_25065 [Leptolyngbya sp. SIO4C1]|nr:hypothetical protein [Leptolyngbya sp. SIO4C1]